MKELLKKLFGIKMPSKAVTKELGKWLEKGE